MTSNVHIMQDADDKSATACGAECLVGRRAFVRDAMTAAAMLAGISTFGPFRIVEAMEARVAGGAVKYAIPAADGVSIDAKNEVILCRSNGLVFAFALSCPHQNTALRALPGTKGFQCPRHKSRYKPDGTFIDGKATRNMDRLPISRDGDSVVVDPDTYFQSDEQPDKWIAAQVKV